MLHLYYTALFAVIIANAITILLVSAIAIVGSATTSTGDSREASAVRPGCNTARRGNRLTTGCQSEPSKNDGR
jgi:hypothetical protein